MEDNYQLIQGDCLEVMKTLADVSVDCVITSPPYYQLRDYGFSGQWGLEQTYQEYLEKLWSLMDEVWRVLKPSGTVWINLGDTYGTQSGAMRDGKFGAKNTNNQVLIQTKQVHKSLLLIPHRFAIGCQDRNWILRNTIIWAKTNGMPESVTDRFSKKHEYIFFFVKQSKYYFDLDAVREDHKAVSLARYERGNSEQNKYWQSGNENIVVGAHNLSKPRPNRKNDGTNFGTNGTGIKNHSGNSLNHIKGKNPGDVADFWAIPTSSNSQSHYATYNTALIEKPIKAGCPVGGTILDPFCGTATTGISALNLNRKFIGIDGNAEYLKIAETNLKDASAQMKLFL
jgi:site-specific DNA-methyltransferase (cytosine-N4-specific)